MEELEFGGKDCLKEKGPRISKKNQQWQRQDLKERLVKRRDGANGEEDGKFRGRSHYNQPFRRSPKGGKQGNEKGEGDHREKGMKGGKVGPKTVRNF